MKIRAYIVKYTKKKKEELEIIIDELDTTLKINFEKFKLKYFKPSEKEDELKFKGLKPFREIHLITEIQNFKVLDEEKQKIIDEIEKIIEILEREREKKLLRFERLKRKFLIDTIEALGESNLKL